MNGTKPILASTGIWGAVAAIIGAVSPIALNAAGITNAADQHCVVEAVCKAVTVLGAGVALYGRLTATKRLR